MAADQNWPEPLNRRQRFEVRQCSGGLVVVTAYEKRKQKPSLVFETGDELIQVKQSDTAIEVMVPPTTYPEADGRFPPQPTPRIYSFSFDQ